MYLVPTFNPPLTSLGRNISQFDRLSLLLLDKSVPLHGEKIAVYPVVPVPVPIVHRSNKAIPKTNEFSLFDGEITINSNESSTKSGPQPLRNKRSFQQLASILDSVVDTTVITHKKAKPLNKPISISSDDNTGVLKASKITRMNEINNETKTVFSIADFVGIEKFCRNAGASEEGLRVILNKIQVCDSISFSVLWKCLTSNHTTLTVKYCSQTNICTHWNCTCDRHIRGNYVANNIIGIVIHIPSDSNVVYFLPLVPCMDSPHTNSSTTGTGSTTGSTTTSPSGGDYSNISLPLQCGTSLVQRINMLQQILSLPNTTKVLYNAQVALIPLLQLIQQQEQHQQQQNHNISINTTTNEYRGHNFVLDRISGISDPRIAAYLLNSDTTEAQLELDSLFQQYPAAASSSSNANCSRKQDGNLSIWDNLPGTGSSSSINSSNSNNSSRVEGTQQLKPPSSSSIDTSTLGRVARVIYRLHTELYTIMSLNSVLHIELTTTNMISIYKDIEIPVTCLLAQMESTGVVVNRTFLEKLREKLIQAIHETEMSIFNTVGGIVFNIASPEQVAKVLYDTLSLPIPSQTSKKGKHQSTSEEDLMRIRSAHPVVDLILQYRALSKVLTTYIDGINPFVVRETRGLHSLLHSPSTSSSTNNANNSTSILPTTSSTSTTDATLSMYQQSIDNTNQQTTHPTTTTTNNAYNIIMQTAHNNAIKSSQEKHLQYRIHANWQQTIVRTGRLSCTKPNLQNIPNEQSIAGIEINLRSAFQASAGCILVSADYSQIEMRVLAHLCRDPVLLRLFSNTHQEYDIYLQLASIILKQPIEDISAEERNKAKVICLGVLYGMGAAATAAKLGMEVAAAGRITQAFFDHFKQIKAWILQIKSQAKQYGMVRTLLGRTRHLADINSDDTAKASYAERQAVNSVIQGTASDIIKLAMANVDRMLSTSWPSHLPAPRLLMQIHDELIYEVPISSSTSSGTNTGSVCASSRYNNSNNNGNAISATSASVDKGAESLECFQALLHRAMEGEVVQRLGFTLPLKVNICTGTDWGSMTKETAPARL